MPESKRHVPESKRHVPDEDKRHMLEDKKQVSNNETIIPELSLALSAMINNLGKRASIEAVGHVIFTLCQWKEMTSDELANLLGRALPAFLWVEF